MKAAWVSKSYESLRAIEGEGSTEVKGQSECREATHVFFFYHTVVTWKQRQYITYCRLVCTIEIETRIYWRNFFFLRGKLSPFPPGKLHDWLIWVRTSKKIIFLWIRQSIKAYSVWRSGGRVAAWCRPKSINHILYQTRERVLRTKKIM